MRFFWAAGFDLETVMLREIQIPGVQDGSLAPGMAQHGGLAVVDPYLRADALEILPSVQMARQPVFLRLGQGKFDIHPAAESQHHDKKAQMPFFGADLD